MGRLLLLLVFLQVLPGIARAADEELVLQVSVSGTKVVVDGQEIAKDAPQRVATRVAPGAHTVRVTKDGFVDFEERVEVAKGKAARVEVLLRIAKVEPLPEKAASKPGAKAPPSIRIAVYELQIQPGMDQRVATLLSEAFLAEVRKLERVSAISMNEVKDMLSFEQQRQLLGCEADACIAEIGGALGVDELVTGSMGALGETQLLTLRRVDMKAASVKGSVQKRYKSVTGEEALALVGPAIEELFSEHALRAGRTRGVSQDALARLNPPPLPRWAFYSTAGVAAVAGLAGSFFGAQFLTAKGEYERLAESSVQTPIDAGALKGLGDRASTNASNANLGFGIAAAFVVVAGVEALFTDWHGYGDAQPAAAPTTAFVVTPSGALVAGLF